MKKVLSTIIIILSFIVASDVLAEYIGFDSYSTGNLGGQGLWQHDTPSLPYIQVTGTGYYSYPQGIYNASTTASANDVYHLAVADTGTTTVSFRVNMNDGVGAEVYFKLTEGGTNVVACRIEYDDPTTYVLKCIDGASYVEYTDTVLVKGEWEIVQIMVNSDTDKFYMRLTNGDWEGAYTTDNYYDSIDEIEIEFHSSVNSSYIDDIYLNQSLDQANESFIQWHFPYNGVEIGNSEWNDWGVNYAIDEDRLYDYNLLRINYNDSFGNYYLDYDFISSSTSLTYWTVNRAYDLPYGYVQATAEIWGTDDDPNIFEPDWDIVAVSETITYLVTSTSTTIFDLGEVGFTPAFSLDSDDIFETATSSEIWDKATQLIKNFYPFNIFYQVRLAWTNSETEVLPDDLDFLTIRDENGDISINIPDEWTGTTTNLTLFSEDFFTESETQSTLMTNLRNLTTYILYILFLFGMIYRAKKLL